MEFSFALPIANSSQFSEPIIIASSLINLSTTVELYKDLNPLNIFDEAVTLWFLMQMLSLIPITIPASFPAVPSDNFWSIFFASINDSSEKTSTNALISSFFEKYFRYP